MSDELADGQAQAAPKAVDWCILTGQPMKVRQDVPCAGLLTNLLPWPHALVPLLREGRVTVRMQEPLEERCGSSLPSLVFSTMATPPVAQACPLTGVRTSVKFLHRVCVHALSGYCRFSLGFNVSQVQLVHGALSQVHTSASAAWDLLCVSS